jgi:NAD+ synthase (glutamine-hydrolysing)
VEEMRENWRIAVGQINCTVGDLRGNSEKILQHVTRACDLGADIVVFPELAVTGYPPEDLLLKTKFVSDNLKAIEELALSIPDIVAVVGFVDRIGGAIFNAAAVLYRGRVRGVYHKTLLPNYGVFDEKRYFSPGTEPKVFCYGNLCFGVNICEDIWFMEGPTATQALMGARLILNINASPYYMGKIKIREEIVRAQAVGQGVCVVYVNLVGGQDEMVFDGQSMVMDGEGAVLAHALPFREDMLIVDLPAENVARDVAGMESSGADEADVILIERDPEPKYQPPVARGPGKPLDPVPEVYEALLLGLRDYVAKNGFQKAAIGLSGGIDSAIVAALAVDALGKENLVGVFMPSRHTSRESREDAAELADRLGIRLMEAPIDGIHRSYISTFEPFFSGLKEDITEENVQARIRGNILMAFSNKFGWLVLTTGNKSEMSVGYATLYGDMAGGFAVIKDVPKTLVYQLARYRNSLGNVIPERILTKEPTAELKPDQKDSDSLLPYDELDPILKAYIEEDRTVEEILSPGMDREAVARTIRMVDTSEYKRRQSPPGIKITPKAFGKDRRMPITSRYKG